MDITSQHADRQVDEFTTSSQTMASAAAVTLETVARNRVQQAERVASAFRDLRSRNVGLEAEVAALRRQIAQITSENVQILKSRQALSENHRRLTMCFADLLKNVEEHCGGAVSVEQRVEATIQAQDFALGSGSDLDVVSKRMADFLNSFVSDPSLSPSRSAI
ncbi:hypothetical protein G6L37_02555 [Agrobacterium rubi]|nr:hypothetical protein [Agrobacterium rubi]NTF24277.1 hypothetical protein [Agrobacterium rubi]